MVKKEHMCEPSFFSLGIAFCLKYDFMRQLHCDARLIFFSSCTVSLGSFPTSTRILCVVGCVRYTMNAHTMGICCVLLEPPINVAYLLQCIAI